TTAMLRQTCHVYNIHVWIHQNGIPIRVQTPIGDRTLEVINAGVNREIEIRADTPWLLMEHNIRGACGFNPGTHTYWYNAHNQLFPIVSEVNWTNCLRAFGNAQMHIVIQTVPVPQP
ncbi:hypothetical protein Tco_1321679, partial [Tanacetum coccineum]